MFSDCSTEILEIFSESRYIHDSGHRGSAWTELHGIKYGYTVFDPFAHNRRSSEWKKANRQKYNEYERTRRAKLKALETNEKVKVQREKKAARQRAWVAANREKRNEYERNRRAKLRTSLEAK